ncbi:MAG: hypothetical protein AB1505_12450 [Candidatus Latescibacterota bacterium]
MLAGSRQGCRPCALLLLAAGALLLWGRAWPQSGLRTEAERTFLHWGNPVQYRNYALEPFAPVPIFGWDVSRYDRLGQYLRQGRVSLSVDEQRPGLSRVQGLAFQQLYEVAALFNVAVLKDSYLGARYALLILPGNDRGRTEPVKTLFSPLTLNMTRFAGVRFDAHGPRNGGSFIFTRGAGARQRFSFFTMGRDERSPVILWGGHWQTTIGSALRLGSSLVNQHIIDTRARQGGVFRGSVPYDMAPPATITVRVVDDSPEDTSSPVAAYGVDVVVHGTDGQGNERAFTSDPALASPELAWDGALEPQVTGRREGDHYEAAGEEERVEFVFSLPGGWRWHRAEFTARVGGDWRLQVRQQHPHTYLDVNTGEERARVHQWPSPPRVTAYEQAAFSTGASLRYPVDFKFPEADPAYTLARSPGTPRDPGAQSVRFTYGIPTAQTLASVNATADHWGVHLEGELATNRQDFQFPVTAGRRGHKDVRAYFLTVSRPFGLGARLRPELGAEAFGIPADYSGNYDARRGGAVFFTGVPVSPPNTALTQEYDLFDDNDDRDQWPDELPDDTGLSEVNDAGVFPGLDANQDNVPDTDQNANGVPDWDEPFLFFWADPPAFLYDVDFNNNGLPDLTENDDLPDYPYPRGQRGGHVFLRLERPLAFVGQIGAGLYRTRQYAAAGESRSRYLRFELGARPRHLAGGQVRLQGDVKWVEDGIADPTYVWKTSTDPYANQNAVQDFANRTYRLIDVVPPDPDPMLMRQSTVTTLFLQGELEAGERVTARWAHKGVVNRQHEEEFADGTRQEEGTLSRITLSTSLQYRYPLGQRAAVYARAKHLYWRDDGYPASLRNHWTTFGPLLSAEVGLTEQTTLALGQEGIPYLVPFRHRDLRDEGRDVDRWTSVAMVRTLSNYVGWKIATEVGLEVRTLDTGGPAQQSRTFFVEMFFGW